MLTDTALSTPPDARFGTPDHIQAMANAMPALISFFDAGEVCRYANEHHCHWYGRTPGELVGLHLRDFLGEEGYALRLPFLARVAAGEEVSFDAAVPHRDGSWHEAAIRYVPKLGPEGFEGFHILVFDTAVLHHRFRSVFEGRAIAFLELDLGNLGRALEDVPSATAEELAATLAADPGFIRRTLDATPITAMNDRAAELFGLDRKESVGTGFGLLCPPAAEPALAANLLAYVGGMTSFEAETVMRRADGRAIDVLLTTAYPPDSERSGKVFLGLIDISARIRQERRLARLESDLAHAARIATLGELMASISHEVSQPLAAVVTNGNAALRWMNRAEPDLDEAKSAIRRMIDEGVRASEIIVRTRALAGRHTAGRTLFCPNAMIEEAAALVRRQVVSLGAELLLELEPGLPEILADRIQLQQVAINLMVNAAQAMAEQAHAPRRITVSTRAAGGVTAFEVTDTGPGVGADSAAQVFNAFYTTKPTGMGLGLSVSKTIVEAHGGTIDLRPAPSGGARFTFTVPHRQNGNAAEDAPHTRV
ncbi:PAS domain-containing sensor histidine kinase [Pararoseomonas indoligenes]|uniref:histidine kinase n=1 Tax=Roseomonas indoligenes TaxID=2820811 RepID=A0A940MXE7_9PROT|nr:ATP-binding protein [Pararoseomonas indoligenes]MBP0495169.1 PAS domain-containing protein [Pararoseomonas indoligenes]